VSDSTHTPRVPFKILVLAPLSPFLQGVWSREPIQVDRLTFDEAMAGLDLTFDVPVPKQVCPAGSISIHCKTLKDFHPDYLSGASTFFSEAQEAKTLFQDATTGKIAFDELENRLSGLSMLPPMEIPSPKTTKPVKHQSHDAIDDILSMVALPNQHQETTPQASGARLADPVTPIIREALEHVYSDPGFRGVEATWRGVRLVLDQFSERSDIALELMPSSSDTLKETLERLETDLQAVSPALVIVDLPLDNSPFSMDMLAEITEFSERMLAPTVCWATHQFLYLDSWAELENLSYLPHHIAGQTYAKWHRVKQSSGAGWVTVTCNPVLARSPYGPGNMPRTVVFEEDSPLWTSPVWPMAGLIAQSMAKTNWPTGFTAWKTIRVEDLPVADFGKRRSCCAMAQISEDRFHQFIAAGITPVLVPKNKDYAFVPDETTIPGGSLAYQCLVARTVQVLMAIEKDADMPSDPDGIATGVRERFSLFWEKTGHPAPTDLAVSAAPAEKPVGEPDGKTDQIVLSISFTPTPDILPSPQKVQFQLLWDTTAHDD